MKKSRALLIGLVFSGCAISPQKKGTMTVADRGTYELSEKGDQYMQTGVYSKKEVTPEYAAGYEKGLSDSKKEEFWAEYDAQWRKK